MTERRQVNALVDPRHKRFLQAVPHGVFSQWVREMLDAKMIGAGFIDEELQVDQARALNAQNRRADLDMAYQRLLAGQYAAPLARHGLKRSVREDLVLSLREWVIDHLDYIPLDIEIHAAIRRNYDPQDPVILATRESQRAALERAKEEAA